MKAIAPQAATKERIFLDLRKAAQRVPMSIRHFRRHIEEDEFLTQRVFEINHKLFILTADLNKWLAEYREKVRRRAKSTRTHTRRPHTPT